jgi:hypothetical protein
LAIIRYRPANHAVAGIAPSLRIDQEDTFYHVLNRSNERRAISRDERDALVYLLWREGWFRLRQIAPHFAVGYTAVSQACRRTERHLEKDRKWQCLPRSRIEQSVIRDVTLQDVLVTGADSIHPQRGSR